MKNKTIKDFIGDKVVYDESSQSLFGVNGREEIRLIADLRGWGAIQNLFKDTNGSIDLDKASKFHDDLGYFIAEAINKQLKDEE